MQQILSGVGHSWHQCSLLHGTKVAFPWGSHFHVLSLVLGHPMHRPGPDPCACHLILQSVDPATAWREREREIFYLWVTQFPKICRAEWGCNKPLIVKATRRGEINSKSSRRFIYLNSESFRQKVQFHCGYGTDISPRKTRKKLLELISKTCAPPQKKGVKFFQELRLLSEDWGIKGVKHGVQVITKLYFYCFFPPFLVFSSRVWLFSWLQFTVQSEYPHCALLWACHVTAIQTSPSHIFLCYISSAVSFVPCVEKE